MDALYYISGILIVLGIPALVIGILTALIKPHLINNRSVIKTAMSRKQIAKIGVTTVLVSFVGLSSVLAATEPASVKQERLAREAAEAKALQIQQQKEADTKREAEERARKAEEEANKPVVKTETKTETIAFKSIEKKDSSLPVGQKKVSIVGVKGERSITYEVTYVRGNETSRKEVSAKVTKKPIDEVTLVGTYVAAATPKPRSAAPSSTLTPRSSSTSGVVKMSRTGICHAPGTTYYDRTTHYTSYRSLSSCLSAGGRLPKR